jgi:uncharacterized membrane protein YdcZ (DUF606 family)
MTQLAYLVLALAVGFGSAVQIGMIGALGHQRGPTEAAWTSLLATIAGIALIFSIRTILQKPPDLPSPFSSSLLFLGIAAAMTIALFLSVRGVHTYLATSGLFGLIYLVSAGFLAPRVGLAVFSSVVTAGTLMGTVTLDQIGAFGANVHHLTVIRGLGIAALLLGVVLVRTGR